MAKRVRDRAWADAVLAEEEVGHLALCDERGPYVIPINYAYLDGTIVIHCATKGRKLDIIRKNPACCFAVDRHVDRVAYHAEKRCHYRYHSVLVFGCARYVEDADERLGWIRRYREHFDARLPWTVPADDGLDITTAERCGIILITIEEVTARRREKADPKAHLARDKTPTDDH